MYEQHRIPSTLVSHAGLAHVKALLTAAGSASRAGSAARCPRLLTCPSGSTTSADCNWSRLADDDQRRVWNELMRREHPHGAVRHVGAQMRYLLVPEHGVLRAVGFAAAALALAARDGPGMRRTSRCLLASSIRRSKSQLMPCLSSASTSMCHRSRPGRPTSGLILGAGCAAASSPLCSSCSAAGRRLARAARRRSTGAGCP